MENDTYCACPPLPLSAVSTDVIETDCLVRRRAAIADPIEAAVIPPPIIPPRVWGIVDPFPCARLEKDIFGYFGSNRIEFDFNFLCGLQPIISFDFPIIFPLSILFLLLFLGTEVRLVFSHEK